MRLKPKFLFALIILATSVGTTSGGLEVQIGDVFRYRIAEESGELFVESHNYLGLNFDLKAGENVFEIEIANIMGDSDFTVDYIIYTSSKSTSESISIDSLTGVPLVEPDWTAHISVIDNRRDLYEGLGWDESITIGSSSITYRLTTICCSSSEGVDEVVVSKTVVFDEANGVVKTYTMSEKTFNSDGTTDEYKLELKLDASADFTRVSEGDDANLNALVGFLGIIVLTLGKKYWRGKTR